MRFVLNAAMGGKAAGSSQSAFGHKWTITRSGDLMSDAAATPPNERSRAASGISPSPP